MSKFAKGFKDFTSEDISFVRDSLHEAIPITGSIVSGTYSDNNIKNYARDLFQSVYDYPYLSSSANHIFDLTVGYVPKYSGSLNLGYVGNARKLNIYSEMAQVALGFNVTGGVRLFDQDGDETAGNKINEAFFINFSRLLMKDEIKKQSVSLQFLTGGTVKAPKRILTLQDHGAKSNYRTNAAGLGEYGILYTASAPIHGNSGVGLIFYQGGIAVVSASIFPDNRTNYIGANDATATQYDNVHALFISSSISGACDALRNRIENISFNNTIDINSTIYTCRANNREFNYSSNQTYLSRSQIVVKDTPSELPRSYVTSIGLYSADNELLAVAKLSEPMEKSPKNSLTFEVRLDY